MTQKQIPVRFTGEEELELYEFLRKESFETGLAMAEIVRQGIRLYQNQKGVNEVKKIEVVIIEAGVDYTERLESFMMNVTGGDEVEKAIAEVEKKGYKVIPNDQGGQNEMCTVTGGSDYIAVTVEPK